MINPHNLEGVGMGESPYAGDLLHLSLKFLSEYTDNKADEIEAMILDPHYSLSHHVILKETGNDTRIFATEIPEVNLDDDPDNDVAYDSFEVKINYPLPYPQIITHRSLADSCEIEYVKKNGEIINDLDDDGEIQEKERLHFPVWQRPDYEDEENWKDINSREDDDDKPEQKNYFISNMIYNQEEVKPLDQIQFIAKNSKFRIKLISLNRNEDAEVVEVLDWEKKVKQKIYLEKKGVLYLSENDIYLGPYDQFYQDTIEINDDTYDFINVHNEINGYKAYFYLKYNNKLKKQFFKKCAFISNTNLYDYDNNVSVKRSMPEILKTIKEKLNYSIIYEESTTAQEFIDYSNFANLIYYNGHGIPNRIIDTQVPNQPTGDFVGFTVDDCVVYQDFNINLFLWTNQLISSNKDVKMIFMNCCYSGKKPGLNDFIDTYNPKIYLGWKDEIDVKADKFAINLFNELALNKNVKTSVDISLKKANINVEMEIRGEDENF